MILALYILVGMVFVALLIPWMIYYGGKGFDLIVSTFGSYYEWCERTILKWEKDKWEKDRKEGKDGI